METHSGQEIENRKENLFFAMRRTFKAKISGGEAFSIECAAEVSFGGSVRCFDLCISANICNT